MWFIPPRDILSSDGEYLLVVRMLSYERGMNLPYDIHEDDPIAKGVSESMTFHLQFRIELNKCSLDRTFKGEH